ncbi:tRNA (adenosine(37)-N6)-threonylcarbamoyltransferase complex dimerization subunit type 1 TsaB [Oxalobacteraceae bacterium CAVE-383]|nr:tRNA (adenosine(37)-N6)-threonylcarbamoyltransferase complex dimerization subunit type 1 TsaB [Oxalobacteraceae bacterium CAVE-383]
MSTILAIETSTEVASAALLNERGLFSRESAGVHTHSEAILPMVQDLLREAGVTLAQCDAIAFGVGPGSFTGVRTACGVVQGLAFGADLPVAPVVTLEAMAQACHEASGALDVLAILDARMGEVYWAQYRYAGAAWHAVTAPTLSAAGLVTPAGAPLACGNGLSAYADAFAAPAFNVLAGRQPAIMPSARQIAVLGRAAAANGGLVPLEQAQPFYLRNKIAFTTAERLAKASA